MRCEKRHQEGTVLDSGFSQISCQILGWNTILYTEIGYPTSISASKMRYLKTFPVPSIRTRQNDRTSCFIKKPRWPPFIGFKTLFCKWQDPGYQGSFSKTFVCLLPEQQPLSVWTLSFGLSLEGLSLGCIVLMLYDLHIFSVHPLSVNTFSIFLPYECFVGS